MCTYMYPLNLCNKKLKKPCKIFYESADRSDYWRRKLKSHLAQATVLRATISSPEYFFAHENSNFSVVCSTYVNIMLHAEMYALVKSENTT